MISDPLYTWDPNTGTASCIIEYDGLTFCGIAKCHPNDEDMQSEKVGMYIAELRAKIKFMQYQKRIDRAKVDALKNLLFSMDRSKHFDRNSYAIKRLYKHLKAAIVDVENDRKLIEDYRIEIKRYIDTKDIFYKYIRRNREKDKNK